MNMSQLARNTHPLGPKLIGIVGAAVALAIVVTFMSVPFLVRREPPAIGDYRLGALMASPDVKLFPNGTFLLTLTFKDGAGELADANSISVTAQMAGMPPNSIEISKVSRGVYRGAGLFPMPGRWVFRVQTPDGTVEIPAGSPGSF